VLASRFDDVKKIITVLLVISAQFAVGQSADYPVNHPAYYLLDYSAATGEKPFFTKMKPYSRQKGIELLKANNAKGFNSNYLFMDSREWSGDSTKSKKSLGRFFQYPADTYSVSEKGFDLHINPVLHFRVGKDSQTDATLFENNRGVELRARIDDRIAIYSMLSENQTMFPAYVNAYRDSVGAIPQEGFWKAYGDGASDFFRAEGYVDVGVTDHVSLQLGYGRHFIGFR
jgi:hypothetical protein